MMSRRTTLETKNKNSATFSPAFTERPRNRTFTSEPNNESINITKHPYGHNFAGVKVKSSLPFKQTCPFSLPGPTYCPFGGACHTCPPQLQTKLAVGKPGDKYEQEADNLADLLMHMPNPKFGLQLEERKQVETLRAKGECGCGPQINPGLESQVLKMKGRGQPLPGSALHFFESRFGHDFSQVRIHADAGANESARAVNARAFTIGQTIVFGSGQYEPITNEGKRLLAHELTHTIQQRAGNLDLTLQRDVIDKARKKLSYSFLDWAITDAEAMEVLAMLGTIPAGNLGAALRRLGSKYITRLLDNLPDAAKTGEVYKRVIGDIGSAGLLPYAKDLLSYGLFDWAITDAEVTRVFNTFENLSGAAREQFLHDLNTAGYLGRLISNSNTGHHALYIRPWIATLTRGRLTQRQRRILRTIVDNTSDVLETLKLATETRFDVTVGRATVRNVTPVDWNPGILRRAYLVLDELPEAHVARNRELLRLGQFEKAAAGGNLTGGMYSPTRREMALNIEIGDVRDTLLHEIGHSVDRRMGWSAGVEPTLPSRGGWTIYRANYRRCARDMVGDSGGAISANLTAAQRTDVINEMATAMGKRSAVGLKRAIRNLAWFAGLPPATRRAVLRDQALEALRVGLTKPWRRDDGGIHIGRQKHVYQDSYGNYWVRYRHDARGWKVSKYQFRDPRDWFAEAYRFYYLPDSRGRGMKLADKDLDTKRYFDRRVHPLAHTR